MPVPPSLAYKFNVEALPLHTDEAGGGGREGMGDAGRWWGQSRDAKMWRFQIRWRGTSPEIRRMWNH